MPEITVQKAAKPEDRKLPIFEDVERMMERIRERAYTNFASRGGDSGFALSDWLAAERELCWPASELIEHEQDYAFSLAMAGFKPSDISVTATPRELIVRASTDATSNEKDRSDGALVCWSELRSANVFRRVELPADIQVDKVTAHYENGMLKVSAPKARPAMKSVPVGVAA